jgi:hypothetical protein
MKRALTEANALLAKQLRRDGIEALLCIILHGGDGLTFAECVPSVDARLVEIPRLEFCPAQRPLLGIKPTWRGLVSMSANDPKRTIVAACARERQSNNFDKLQLHVGRPSSEGALGANEFVIKRRGPHGNNVVHVQPSMRIAARWSQYFIRADYAASQRD